MSTLSNLTWRDFTRPGTPIATLCAVFLVLSAVWGTLIRFNAVGEPLPAISSYNSTMDPSYLLAKWTWHRSIFTPMLIADLFAAVALLLLIFTALQLRKIYRSHSGLAHRTMFYCFVAGGFLPVIELLQNLGLASMAKWMTDPDSSWRIMTNNGALQALDVAYTVTASRSLWVFSLMYLLIGAGMCLEYYLEYVNDKGQGLKWHSRFALGCAGLAFLGWVMELASFWSPETVMFVAGILYLVFIGGLCVWCLWLAFRIFPKFDESSFHQPMQYI